MASVEVVNKCGFDPQIRRFESYLASFVVGFTGTDDEWVLIVNVYWRCGKTQNLLCLCREANIAFYGSLA